MRQDPEEPRETEPFWPPMPAREPDRRRRGGIGLAIAVALLAAAVGGAATVALEQDSPDTQTPMVRTASLNTTAISREVESGMVDVVARDGYSGLVSEGTGLILSADGLVLTNNHIIAGSTSVLVTVVGSGRTYAARVVGYDSAADVALLRLVDASRLRPIQTSGAQFGQPVIALGNAGGQGGAPTVTSGYVVALHQTITPANATTGATETLRNVIETSAEITSGDSGGALADARARVVGMITASALGPNGDAIGYAIPIGSALRIVRLIQVGRTTADIRVGIPGFLGVSVTDSPGSCGETGGPGTIGPAVTGAKICAVYPGTSAAAAGLRIGDVIVSAGGQAIAGANALTGLTERLNPGASLSVTYLDSKAHPHTIRLTLTSGPAE
jgi:S1-C subfamily serine protease